MTKHVHRTQYRLEVIRGTVWDRWHGFDTEEQVDGVEYARIIDSDDVSHFETYMATTIGTFKRVVRGVKVDRNQYTFVDIGCGKGRALILAAEMGFRNVVGVEISPHLCQIAQRNVERWLSMQRDPDPPQISVIRTDATQYEFPSEPMLVFIYNPFDAEILAQVISRLTDSLKEHPRDVVILYRWAVHQEVFSQFDSLSLVHSERRFQVYRTCPTRETLSRKAPGF